MWQNQIRNLLAAFLKNCVLPDFSGKWTAKFWQLLEMNSTGIFRSIYCKNGAGQKTRPFTFCTATLWSICRNYPINLKQCTLPCPLEGWNCSLFQFLIFIFCREQDEVINIITHLTSQLNANYPITVELRRKCQLLQIRQICETKVYFCFCGYVKKTRKISNFAQKNPIV